MSENEKCAFCDKDKNEHHEFKAKPLGCKCDPTEWSVYRPIPKVCTDYVLEDFFGQEICDFCEHDKECHLNVTK